MLLIFYRTARKGATVKLALLFLMGISMTAFSDSAAGLPTTVSKEVFGKMPDGTPVEIYTLKDGKTEARIMGYGAILVSLKTPDRNGNIADIVLGYDSLDGYTGGNNGFFGAIAGRYANRIAHGTFTLDGKTYSVPKNDGENSLHGGTRGFDNAGRERRGHELDRQTGATRLLEQRFRLRQILMSTQPAVP